MLNFIIFVGFIAIFTFFTYKKKGGFTASIFLLGLYLLCGICSLLDIYFSKDYQILNPSYLPFAILFVAYLYLFIAPFVKVKEQTITTFVLPNKHLLDAISNVIIVLSMGAIVFFSNGVRSVFQYSSLVDARNDRYYQEMSFMEAGPIYTIFSVAASLFVFALLLFFVYSAIGGNKKKRILLLISSISEPLHVLTEVGRDGIVFWIFTFAFFFLLFKDYLPYNTTKKLKKYSVIMIALISIPFLLISFSRFSEDVVGGMVSYMGQQFKHFCYYMELPNRPLRHGADFPLWFEVTGQIKPERGSWVLGYTDSGAFRTFIGGFVQNFNVIGTFVVGLILAVFVKLTLKIKNHAMTISQLFLYITFFEVYAQGVFYFRHFTRGGNLFIIICIIGWFVFKQLSLSDNNKIILTKRV